MEAYQGKKNPSLGLFHITTHTTMSDQGHLGIARSVKKLTMEQHGNIKDPSMEAHLRLQEMHGDNKGS